ncbi:MAG TPA: gas vesicle protein [Ktedonobacteraceae bacterium]|nr:gas vesicle protein [Ktedonobacteraceae bacterium]
MAQQITSLQTTNLADLLDRILDKGIVIVGDIKIDLVEVELLTIKIRLLIASVDKAKAIGIDWWEGDPFLKSLEMRKMAAENEELKQRVASLEKKSSGRR